MELKDICISDVFFSDARLARTGSMAKPATGRGCPKSKVHNFTIYGLDAEINKHDILLDSP